MSELSRDDIERDLRGIGFAAGDIVLLHSSLASLGQVKGGAETVIDAFLSVLGPTGCLVVPTFGALGIITEVLRARPDAVNSIHPRASVAAVGAMAREICADHWLAETAHGDDTPYMRIAELGGYVCLLGVDQDRNTTLHTVEELLRLPYLERTREFTFETPSGMVSKSWPFFPGPHRDFIGLDQELRARGVVKMGRVGGAVVRVMKSRELIDAALEMGRRDPAFVLCHNPSCHDCLRQRAALRKERYTGGAFRVSASAMLAGRYVEEIADACRLQGLGAVELDGLGDEPASRWPLAKLEKVLARFLEEDVVLSGLRLSAYPEDFRAVARIAHDAGVGRVVLPLADDPSRYAVAAAEAGVRLSLVNSVHRGQQVRDVCCKHDLPDAPVHLAFSPVGFVASGENPFLCSYRRRLRRFIDQLYLEDATFGGRVTRLAEGNAEIKELLSILEACSFAGWFVLGERNRQVGTLSDALRMLDGMLAAL